MAFQCFLDFYGPNQFLLNYYDFDRQQGHVDSALVDKHLENLQRQERFLDNKIIKHCK